MNREMLKECIADAKTIRESAIANAKLALEEAFTPQLTAMFAERLNELELEESEAERTPVDKYSMEEEQIKVDETFNLEELLAELEMEEGQDPTMEGDDMNKSLEEDLMLEEMSDEEIEELVMKTIEDMIASGKLMAGEEAEDEDVEDMDDMDDMGGEEEIEGEEEEEDEDINLEELLAEIDSMEEDETSMEEGVFTGIKNLAKKMVGKLTDEQKKNREELIQATEKQVKAAKLDNGQPITAQSFLTYKEGDGDDLRTQIIKWVDSEKADAVTTNFKGKFNIRSGSQGGVTLNWVPEYSTFQKATMGASGAAGSQVGAKQSAFESELEEAYAAIAELRNELNEVNLLNAKLLYTNKIFKAKNLTESEKIKVLNTFDKAETVKEVKLVFETLTESFKATTAKKNTIKESLGSASKTISTATPKQPIIESNEAFARMQRLAGLRK